MLQDIVTKDSTDRSVTLRIIDSTTGLPENAVEHDTSGIDLWYRREGAAKVSITEAALAALTTAHTDGGIELIADGEYRLDLPDAAFATGANYVDYGGTITDMIVIGGRVRLVDVDLEDAVRAGLTALPNAAADAAGGLVISDAGGLDIDTKLATATSALATPTNITAGTITTVTTLTGHTPQTGDTYALANGAAGFVAIDTVVDAILVDTAVIGALGAGLTAVIGADGDTLKTISDQIDGLSTASAPQLLQNTTIATLASQTSFTLTDGSADDDAYNGGIIVVTDQATATQKAVGSISDYVGSTKTVTLSSDPAIFTMAVGDTVDILAAIGSAPTVAQIRTEMDNNSTQLAAIVASQATEPHHLSKGRA